MKFVNFTNHPVSTWTEEQKKAAEAYGEIEEIPFPMVRAAADEKEILSLAESMAEKIMSMEPAAVLCQGEFTLAYAVIVRLKQKGVKVLAACSERMVEINEEGKKVVSFHFERFREYV